VTHRRALGSAGEAAVARWYEQRGYAVVARNWRSRLGELDLVVTDARHVVFCEVKTRSTSRFGTPFDAVTAAKQKRLRSLAFAYLEAHPELRRRPMRFDVASVVPGGDEPRVDVLEAAF
jgi:putative endonuclease